MDTHPTPITADESVTPAIAARTIELLAIHQRSIWRRTDRLLAGLLACEWLAIVILASCVSPRSWDGAVSSIHPHVWAALVLGGAIVSLPIYLAFALPASALTRHATATAQMLMSALLIHIGGGRIELHFHVFGSFAFLAFYRDWRVLVTAMAVVVVDHLARGIYAPESVFGTTVANGWRVLEHGGWVIFENVFLIAACVQGVREMSGIALSRALIEANYREVEKKVADRTQELKDAHEGLIKSARSAGMAEIATSVLHNVGNVLNSVNVSATVVTEKLKQSEVQTLTQVSDLMVEHKADLGTFITQDARGQMIPDFIRELATCLSDEQKLVIAEVESLTKGIDHIKQIVVAQQSMAKRATVNSAIEPAKLFENAITMQMAGHRSDIVIERSFDPIPPSMLDQHKVLQILINLISNARQATAANQKSAKFLRLGLHVHESAPGGPRVRFSVADNGVGIAPEHLTRIFGHGFTTKQDGHGFGLHSAANAAREMGGGLTVASDGVGKGATFTLDLPIVLETAAPQSVQSDATFATAHQEDASCH